MADSNDSDTAFLERWAALVGSGDDIAVTLGLEPVSCNASRVVVRMPHHAGLSQPSGLFSAASLFGLADIAGTFLALEHTAGHRFPLAVQSNVHLLGNVREGTATAVATLVKAGRTFILTSTEVLSDDGRLLSSVQTTYLNPS